MEVLNFFVKRKSKLSSLYNCLLGQMSNFYNRTPFAVVFLSFQIFQVRENLKTARGAAGNKFLGVVPPLFPWNCLGQFPGWVCLARHLIRLIFGFFQFSFFAHAKDEMRKLTRRAQTRPMRFFFYQRGLVRDRGWLLPSGRSPSVRILDLFVVIQNMTKSTTELKSYGVKV